MPTEINRLNADLADLVEDETWDLAENVTVNEDGTLSVSGIPTAPEYAPAVVSAGAWSAPGKAGDEQASYTEVESVSWPKAESNWGTFPWVVVKVGGTVTGAFLILPGALPVLAGATPRITTASQQLDGSE